MRTFSSVICPMTSTRRPAPRRAAAHLQRRAASRCSRGLLRTRWLVGRSARRFAAALGDLEGLASDRYPTRRLVPREHELRDNVTVHDAACIAVVEALDGPLETTDSRLAKASEIPCAVGLVCLGDDRRARATWTGCGLVHVAPGVEWEVPR